MSHFQTLTVAIISQIMARSWLAAAVLGFSIPPNGTSAMGAWATFYDDENCSVNPGMAVSMNNPGCLNEAGRGSFMMRDDHRKYLVIVSPSNGCHCQSHCEMLVFRHDTPCIQLTGNMRGSSYRFVVDRKGWCPNRDQC